MKRNGLVFTNKVHVKQDPEAPVAKDVLAKAIVDISASMQKLLASGLNRKAIVTLIADATKQPKRQIEYVLNSLEQLAQDYTR